MKRILPYFTFILLFQQNLFKFFPLEIINILDEFFIIYVFIMFLKEVGLKRKISKSSLFLISLVVAFSIVGVISFILNGNGSYSVMVQQLLLSVKTFIGIAMLTTIPDLEKSLVKIISLLKVVGIINAIVVIIGFIFPNIYLAIFKQGFIDMSRTLFGRGANCGIFVHPMISGFISIFCMVLCLGSLKYYNDKSIKNKILIFILLISGLLSFKAKLIAEVVAILILYFLLGSTKQKIISVLKFTIPVIIVAFLLRNIVAQQINTYILDDENLSIARNALNYYSRILASRFFPFGAGFSMYGTFMAYQYYSPFYYEFGFDKVWGLNQFKGNYATDTYWPGILGETGLIGTIILITFLGYLGFKVLRQLNVKKFEPDSKVVYFSFITGMLLVQSLIESSGNPVFTGNPFSTLIVAFFGCGISIIVNRSKIN